MSAFVPAMSYGATDAVTDAAEELARIYDQLETTEVDAIQDARDAIEVLDDAITGTSGFEGPLTDYDALDALVTSQFKAAFDLTSDTEAEDKLFALVAGLTRIVYGFEEDTATIEGHINDYKTDFADDYAAMFDDDGSPEDGAAFIDDLITLIFQAKANIGDYVDSSDRVTLLDAGDSEELIAAMEDIIEEAVMGEIQTPSGTYDYALEGMLDQLDWTIAGLVAAQEEIMDEVDGNYPARVAVANATVRADATIIGDKSLYRGDDEDYAITIYGSTTNGVHFDSDSDLVTIDGARITAEATGTATVKVYRNASNTGPTDHIQSFDIVISSRPSSGGTAPADPTPETLEPIDLDQTPEEVMADAADQIHAIYEALEGEADPETVLEVYDSITDSLVVNSTQVKFGEVLDTFADFISLSKRLVNSGLFEDSDETRMIQNNLLAVTGEVMKLQAAEGYDRTSLQLYEMILSNLLEINGTIGGLDTVIKTLPQEVLNIFGITTTLDPDSVAEMVDELALKNQEVMTTLGQSGFGLEQALENNLVYQPQWGTTPGGGEQVAVPRVPGIFERVDNLIIQGRSMSFIFAEGSFDPSRQLGIAVAPLTSNNTFDIEVTEDDQPLTTVRLPIIVNIPLKNGSDDLVLFHLKNGVWVPVPGHYDEARQVYVAFVKDFSPYALMASRGSFDDVGETDWFRDPVEILAGRGIIQGRSESAFAPSDNISRGEFITLMMRAMALGHESQAPVFKDVDPEDYYYESIAAAHEAGIVTGTGDGSFNPDAPITRQEIATMLARGLEYKGHLLRSQDQVAFTDLADVAVWATDPLRLTVSRGIISGYPDGGFAPESPATRAEAAAMIYRYMEK